VAPEQVGLLRLQCDNPGIGVDQSAGEALSDSLVTKCGMHRCTFQIALHGHPPAPFRPTP
jgi:hypothetical protein